MLNTFVNQLSLFSPLSLAVLSPTDKFTYPGSTISSNLSLDSEMDTSIGKATAALARRSKRVRHQYAGDTTRMKVYLAVVLSTFL